MSPKKPTDSDPTAAKTEPSEEAALIHADKDLLDSLYTQAAITTVGLIAASIWYAFRLVERARAETDALLRNILPDSVADRLKAQPGELVADTHDEVSVLFADISGFVALARSIGAERVVDLLNYIVSEFDKLAARHGVEKIKTIGDAYMAAAGLPEPIPILAAVVAGASALFVVAWIMKSLQKLRSEGTARIERAVGTTGTVYLSIPGQKSGVGKVHLNLQNRTVEYQAMTAEQPLPTGAKVVVVKVINSDTVEVAPATSTERVPHA